jgi:TonB family protein
MNATTCSVLTVILLALSLNVGAQGSADAPTRPRLIDIQECKPAYPKDTLRAEEEGKTAVRLHVAASGELRGVSLVRSSGSARLDQAVIDAMSRCRFAPGRQGGAAVEGDFTIEYVWRLEPPTDRICRPVYPAASIEAEEQGMTALEFHVGENGKASDIRVATSSGYERLDAASIEALRRCTFRVAASAAGASAPAAGPRKMQFNWKLEGGVPLLPTFPLGPVAPDPYRPAL